MKIWTEGVSKAEVEAEISAFFQVLRRGDLKLARNSVTHHSDDWEHQIWSLWQDTWLIVLEDRDEEVADESFLGGLWRSDRSWLQSIDIEDSFHWDDVGERAQPDASVYVNIICDGVVTDVSAEFSVVRVDGGLALRRDRITRI